MVIVVRVIFYKNRKYYPLLKVLKVFLDDFLYKL